MLCQSPGYPIEYPWRASVHRFQPPGSEVPVLSVGVGPVVAVGAGAVAAGDAGATVVVGAGPMDGAAEIGVGPRPDVHAVAITAVIDAATANLRQPGPIVPSPS